MSSKKLGFSYCIITSGFCKSSHIIICVSAYGCVLHICFVLCACLSDACDAHGYLCSYISHSVVALHAGCIAIVSYIRIYFEYILHS